jgi:hypothetical protein
MVEIVVPNYFPEAEITATSFLVGDLTQSIATDSVGGETPTPHGTDGGNGVSL